MYIPEILMAGYPKFEKWWALEQVDSGSKIWPFLVSGIYVRFAGCNYQLKQNKTHPLTDTPQRFRKTPDGEFYSSQFHTKTGSYLNEQASH